MQSYNDPYELRPEKIRAAPVSLKQRLRFLGPSFILSASIVGSGELIATTTLGAEAGFITFWVIIIGCFIKVAVQLEFGKHSILSGETAMQAFNQMPGPKIGKANWSIWFVFLVMVIKLLQVGGIVGGVAIILNMAFPFLPIPILCIGIALFVALLVRRGYYKFVETFSLVLIALFTVLTFTSLYFLSFTEYKISWEQIWSGMQFKLPKELIAVAFGAFGITGVGGDEIIHYNYWCLEKGYASYTGPQEDTEAWKTRARGWIKVMHLDAFFAMLIYTTVTAAFYLLGAAVLNAQGEVPNGFAMIETLSAMYTSSLGPGAKNIFLIGAFITLFSTLFAALAAWIRQIADIFGQLGWIDFKNLKQRQKLLGLLAFIVPLLWAITFIFIQLPVMMVLIGGIVGSFLLFVVVLAAIHFRYVRLIPSFKPGVGYDLFFWISVLSIIAVGILGISKALT